MAFYSSSGESEASTIRPSATSIFAIDSDDRYKSFGQRRTNPTYPFSFSIQKNEAFLSGFFKRIALTEFRMNWTLPNISQAWGNNQMLVYVSISGVPQNGGLPYTLTLYDGFYGAEELAAEMQRVMRTVPGMTNAIVTLGGSGTDTTPDEWYYISSNSSTAQFYFNPMPNNPYRQLIDMLNIPAPTGSTYQFQIFSGIPTLRATDYVDIVCSQLTQNQNLRDATTTTTNRDMIARIYLDESTPSRSTTVTNNYSGTTMVFVTPTAVQSTNGNVVRFTINNPGFDTIFSPELVGSFIVMSAIAGAPSYNGSGRLLDLNVTAGVWYMVVEYDFVPTGTPTFGGSPRGTFYQKIETVSIPQQMWDDNINGVTPFVLYRQFITPKQIRWSGRQPIGNMKFEMYDDMGRSIQDLWNIYPPSTSPGSNFANSFSWNATMLCSED